MSLGTTVADIAELLQSERARLIANRLLHEHEVHNDLRSWVDYRKFVEALRATNTYEPSWMGAEYADVGIPGHELALWVGRGLLFFGYKSRHTSEYRLVDPEATKMALLAFTEPVVATEEPAGIPDDLFDIIYGHDAIKRLLRFCLEAHAPVNALLVGSPGSAKSMFLDEIGRCGPSHYMVANLSSKAGITEYLLSDAACQYLRVDEFEKGSVDDLNALLSLMETGLVTQTKFGKTQSKHRICWVFGAANTLDGISLPMRDRFNIIPVPDLGHNEFVATAQNVLTRRVGLDAELANEIATLCAERTHQLRRARDIGLMCKGDRKLARELINSFLPLPY